jgi:hypothetical protein
MSGACDIDLKIWPPIDDLARPVARRALYRWRDNKELWPEAADAKPQACSVQRGILRDARILAEAPHQY